MNFDWPGNFSGGQEVTSIASFFEYANYGLQGYLGTIILIAVFVISLLILSVSKASKGFSVSLMITTVMSILLMLMEILNWYYVVVCGFLWIVSLLLLKKSTDSNL